jgi:ABC-type amino acid transport substrate-binding protein
MRLRGCATALVAALLALTGCTSGEATTTTTAPPPTTAAAADATTTTILQEAVASSGFRTRRPNELIVGTEQLAPPWFTGPPSGVVTGGFDYAIAQEIGSRLGVPIVTVVRSSLVLMMTGQDCGCDVMLGGITITDGRARTLDLSEPYIASDQAVLTRKGTVFSSTTEASLLRWAVGVRNVAGSNVLTERVKPIPPTTMVVNEEDGVRMLEQARVDAVMIDLPHALAFAQANPAVGVVAQFRTGAQDAVALPLGSPNTTIINDVIQTMRDDGIIDALVRTYLGTAPDEIPLIPS